MKLYYSKGACSLAVRISHCVRYFNVLKERASIKKSL